MKREKQSFCRRRPRFGEKFLCKQAQKRAAGMRNFPLCLPLLEPDQFSLAILKLSFIVEAPAQIP